MKGKKKKYFLIYPIAVLFMIPFLPFPVSAEVPQLISYQGYLTNSDGAPYSQTMSITFNIYNTESGGTPLWTSTENIDVSNGIFNTILGKAKTFPAGLFSDNDELYLAVQLFAESEMTPRERITSVPKS